MKRLLFILLFVLPLTVSGQQKLVKVRVTLQWLPQSQFAGIYMAKEKGFYEAEGLDVEIIHPSPSVSSATLLKEGKTDIMTSQLIEALLSIDAGFDIVNILQTAEHNSLYILSREPLESVTDLNHKKIGRWNAGFSELGMVFVNEYGLDVEWIPFLTNIAFYISGAIDATLCMGYNEFFQLKMSGTPITEKQVIKFRDIGYDIPEDGLYSTRKFCDSHPELIEKFITATKKGWEWVANPDNEEETLDYVMNLVEKGNVSTNRINQKFMLEEILKLQKSDDGTVPFYLSKERFDFAMNLLLRNNFIFNSIRYEEHVRTY